MTSLNSGSTFFHQSKEVVAEIAGEKIKYNEFQAAIEQMTSVYKIETGQSEMNEEMTSQIRKSVWENFVNERILNEEAAKIGLSVGKEELTDRLIGKNVPPVDYATSCICR
ncbi:MAG: SurA N-terminal domain-containing protein [Paludibacteraceae bacterium]